MQTIGSEPESRFLDERGECIDRSLDGRCFDGSSEFPRFFEVFELIGCSLIAVTCIDFIVVWRFCASTGIIVDRLCWFSVSIGSS